MRLRTSAFTTGGEVPIEFTGDGANVSPPLEWTPPPSGTESLALIVDDPDAPHGAWVHWLVYNIPPTERGLPEAVAPHSPLPCGAEQGRNDFGRIEYGGPCPPAGHPHRYFFKIFALDTRLALSSGASRADVERAMRGHVLASGEMMGRYRRHR